MRCKYTCPVRAVHGRPLQGRENNLNQPRAPLEDSLRPGLVESAFQAEDLAVVPTVVITTRYIKLQSVLILTLGLGEC